MDRIRGLLDKDILKEDAVAGFTSVVGMWNIYTSDEWVGRTIKKAYHDALEWVEERRT